MFTNTAWVTAPRRAVVKGGGWGLVRLRVRCGLIVHPEHGPVLIDTGYGPRVTGGTGRGLPLRVYNAVLGPRLNPLESPLALLAGHGFVPEDVGLVLLTHLHADHVSYARDLPNARFISDGPGQGHWRHGVFNELLPDDFAERRKNVKQHPMVPLPFDMGVGYDVLGDGSCLAVGLPGHAPGHYGLCFPGAEPLLYATDAQWMKAALAPGQAPALLPRMIGCAMKDSMQSTEFVRQFAAMGGEILLCHDPEPSPNDWSPSDV